MGASCGMWKFLMGMFRDIYYRFCMSVSIEDGNMGFYGSKTFL